MGTSTRSAEVGLTDGWSVVGTSTQSASGFPIECIRRVKSVSTHTTLVSVGVTVETFAVVGVEIATRASGGVTIRVCVPEFTVAACKS
jgi:hypothetical protein